MPPNCPGEGGDRFPVLRLIFGELDTRGAGGAVAPGHFGR